MSRISLARVGKADAVNDARASVGEMDEPSRSENKQYAQTTKMRNVRDETCRPPPGPS